MGEEEGRENNWRLSAGPAPEPSWSLLALRCRQRAVSETPQMFQPLNSSQSSKMMLHPARGIKAAALQAGSRRAGCLITVEVSACRRCVERGARGVLGRGGVPAVICRQCSPVSAVLGQQHLPQRGFGKNVKATPCAICGVLEKGRPPLFSGCTPPGRLLCSESVPLAS